MKTKSERKNFLRERAIAKGMFAVAAFIAVSRGEIRETAREVKASVSESMNDEIRDDEEIGFNSGLSFDQIREAKIREDDFLLSAQEKAQLKADRRAYELARESVAIHA